MQFRHYWSVIRRRWPILALVVGLVALGGGLSLVLTPRQYSAEVRLLLNREPTQARAGTGEFRYDDLYRFQATEYGLDDLVEEVRGNRFAATVVERLQERGVTTLTEEQVMRALRPERTHRVLNVEVTAPSRELAMTMTEVVEDLLTKGADRYAPPDGSRVNPRVIHRDPKATSNLSRTLLTYALQLFLALLLGLGLTFLLHYLDDRVREPAEMQELGVPLLGHLPPAR